MNPPETALAQQLPKRIESPVGAEIVVDGRRCINFGGSSYLGVSGMPAILKAGVDALKKYGSGIPLAYDQGVRFSSHIDAETAAANYFSSEASIFLSSGYFVGMAALSAVKARYTVAFYDEFSHFSLRDALAMSLLPIHPFKHLDAEDLATKLRRNVRRGARPLVVTDGLFSTLGEIAPLNALMDVSANYDSGILVDESHSFGVLGCSGRGVSEHHDLVTDRIISGGSLGKAFGTSGGIVLGTLNEVEGMRATGVCRGSSPGIPAAAAMAACSLKYVRENPCLLRRLRSNVGYLKSALRGLGLDAGDSVAPVAAFRVGSSRNLERLRQKLFGEGIFVYKANYIGAPSNDFVRCGIFADHTKSHIDELVSSLGRNL